MIYSEIFVFLTFSLTVTGFSVILTCVICFGFGAIFFFSDKKQNKMLKLKKVVKGVCVKSVNKAVVELCLLGSAGLMMKSVMAVSLTNPCLGQDNSG